MAGRVQGGRRGRGGIFGLVRTVGEYGEAIDYDLMTRAGMTLRDWESGRLDSRSLVHFIKWLGPESAYFRASHPDEVETIAWVDGSAICALLAELIDVVRYGTNTLNYKGTGKRAPRIEPYDRPWKRKNAKRYGKKPIPIKSFDEWYYGGDA